MITKCFNFFRFHCPFCKATTELPPEYFVHLDHTGVRLDKYQRPELWLGSYEFVGTKEYCRNNTFPKPPAFVFVIDVSYNNVKSGLVHLLCQNMKNILKHLPREVGAERSVVRVGFITYSNEVHFYNIKSTLAQPQMMVVGDVQVITLLLIILISYSCFNWYFNFLSGYVYASFGWISGRSYGIGKCD